MNFSPEQIAALKAKLNPDNVASREQAGRRLSYVEGWHVIAEANRIFGFDAWDRELVSIKLLGEPRGVDGKARVGYMATVRVTVRAGGSAIVREGTGFGSGIDRDVDQAHESALKEAETDAMKRALMTFGNPFGLALYDKSQTSVGYDEPEPDLEGNAVVADTLVELVNGAADRQYLRDLKAKNAPRIQELDGVNRRRVTSAMKAKWHSLPSDEPVNTLEAG